MGLHRRIGESGLSERVHDPLDRVHERRRRRTAAPHCIARREALEREPDDGPLKPQVTKKKTKSSLVAQPFRAAVPQG